MELMCLLLPARFPVPLPFSGKLCPLFGAGAPSATGIPS
jgi:hypothetical protein